MSSDCADCGGRDYRGRPCLVRRSRSVYIRDRVMHCWSSRRVDSFPRCWLSAYEWYMEVDETPCCWQRVMTAIAYVCPFRLVIVAHTLATPATRTQHVWKTRDGQKIHLDIPLQLHAFLSVSIVGFLAEYYHKNDKSQSCKTPRARRQWPKRGELC